MTDDEGLLYAYLLNGQGGGESFHWNKVRQWKPEQGVLWVHLEYSKPFVQRWVLHESGLDEVTAEALLAEETRAGSILTAHQKNRDPHVGSPLSILMGVGDVILRRSAFDRSKCSLEGRV